MKTIGFIGTGIMGLPMAMHLLQAGYTLLVKNRTVSKLDPLLKKGAIRCDSAKDMARQCDAVITMLPNSPDVEKVALGQDGALQGAHPRMLFIDMGSIDPSVSRTLHKAFQEKGAMALDAPVSGGEAGAIQATLSIMVGGQSEAFEAALPLLQCLGQRITLVGEAGSGQVCKLANNIVVGANIASLSEALAFAASSGVDPAKVLSAMQGGMADSHVLQKKGPKMLERDFRPGFYVDLHHKDLTNATLVGACTHCPLPITELVRDMLAQLIEEGKSKLDHDALVQVYERCIGRQIGPQK